jgi:hypothetical protein
VLILLLGTVPYLVTGPLSCRRNFPWSPDPGDAGSLASALDDGLMDTAPALYRIRINGHLGATTLPAFPAMTPQWHGAGTVLTGPLDRSALYGMLAEIDALGLDPVEVCLLTPDPEPPEPSESSSLEPG